MRLKTAMKILLLLCALVCVLSCIHRSRENESNGQVDVAELESDIRLYEDIINERIAATEGFMAANRALANHYNNLGMYALALQHYEEILGIEPANAGVLNSAGIAAGQTALSRPTLAERNEYLLRAQRYYERAIDINPDFRDPHFGLAVLQIYELEDLSAGRASVLRALSIFPEDVRLLFVSAHLAVVEGRISDAIDSYEQIIAISSNESEINSAKDNRDALFSRY